MDQIFVTSRKYTISMQLQSELILTLLTTIRVLDYPTHDFTTKIGSGAPVFLDIRVPCMCLHV